MSSNDLAATDFLKPEIQQVVPLICGFDNSGFSQAAREALRDALNAYDRKVTYVTAVEEVSQALIETNTERYQYKIAPLELWKGQATWCAWFISEEEIEFKGLREWISRTAAEVASPIQHFVFAHTPNRVDSSTIAAARNHAKELPGSTLVFILSDRGALRRKASTIGAAVTPYLYGAWRRYCEVNDRRLDRALLLPIPEELEAESSARLFTLGLGTVGPDLEYQRERCGQMLAQALLKQWNKSPGTALPHEFDPPLRLARVLLPRNGYAISQESGNPDDAPALEFENSPTLTLTWNEPQIIRSKTERTERAAMLAFLARLKDHFFHLREVTRDNTRRYMERNAPRRLSALKEEFRNYSRWPKDALSAFHSALKRIDNCASYARNLASVELDERPGISEFDRAGSRAHARISSIPNFWSPVLRLALIIVGLSWLFIGGLTWGEFKWGGFLNPFSDDLANRVAFGAFVLIILMVTGLVYQHWASRLSASRALDQLEERVGRTHIGQVGSDLANQLHGIGRNLLSLAEEWRTGLEALVGHLKQQLNELDLRHENQAQRYFPDEGVDAIIAPRSGELVEQVHEQILSSLGDKGVAECNPEELCNVLMASANAIAARTLRGISFKTFLEESQLTDDEGVALIEDAVQESHRPAASGLSIANPPTALCAQAPVLLERCQFSVESCDVEASRFFAIAVFELPAGPRS